ncbi:hypothetical protein Tco_0061223, partial [Tanacetum coccineum]
LPLAPPPLPVSLTYPLGYRATMIWLRDKAPSTSYSPPPHIILSHTRADTPPSGTPPSGTPPLLPIPLPTSSPPLHLLSTDRRADRPKVTLPPQKRLGIALGPRYKVGESSSAPTARPPGGFRADYGFVATIDREIMWDLERDVGYEITNTWDEMLVDMPRAPATDDTELGRRMTEFATKVRKDTDEIYVRLDDEQTERKLMRKRLGYLERLGDDPWTLVILHVQRLCQCVQSCWHRTAGSDLARLEVGSAGSDYRVTGSGPQEIGGDYRIVGSEPQETGTVH